MTTEEQQESLLTENPPPGFIMRFFPWILAAGILLIYLFTLNHWATLKNLPGVAKITGWDWRPNTTEPLYFLLTYPIRWLSSGTQLLALNLFSAICAALTLALLARSVVILPEDRTHEQRQRKPEPIVVLDIPFSWLPPLVAVLIFGFQFAFWENAVVATGEMLNLLVFAYVIRCILEFRYSRKESWLTKMALVYGLGITNNWALLGFLPFLLIGLIWIKGRSFFNFRFLLRMLLFGLIGLTLYLLYPLLSQNPDRTFLQTLLDQIRLQKGYVFDLPFKQITPLRGRLLIMSLTSLLPLLLIGIRWPSFRGDLNAIGGMMTVFMFRLAHLFFFGILLSIFFDVPYSPYKLGFQLMPYLTFYYLSALAVGYFAGYALIIFKLEPMVGWARPSAFFRGINQVILVAVGLTAIVVPAVLAWKNFPAIRAANSNAVSQFAKFTAESLPANNAVVLSDDPTLLFLIQAANAKKGRPTQNILVETGSLQYPSYQRYLHQHFPKDWPEPNPTNEISQVELIQHLERLSQSHKIFYMNASFGYYFEKFYPIPHELVYELKTYPGNDILPPPLPKEVIMENQNFWNQFAKETLPPLPALGKQSDEVKLINSYYSRALNNWGVQLQKASLLKEANQAFTTAVQLNPDNGIAEVNRQFNENRQRGEFRAVRPDNSSVKNLARFGSLPNAILANGTFDERDFCIQLGILLGQGNNFRQSAQYFMRALELAPKSVEARIGLAKTYISMQRADDALKLVQQIHDGEKTTPLSDQNKFELLQTEALVYLAKNDFPTAEKLVQTSQKQNPKDQARLALLSQLYLQSGRYDEALKTVQKQLEIAPENPGALFTEAVLNMQLNRFSKAVEILNRVISLQPKNYDARLNRAIAYLQLENFEEARHDYETLRNSLPKEKSYPIYFRLGDLAEKQNNKPEAIKNYTIFLKRAPANAPGREEVLKRLAELQGGKS